MKHKKIIISFILLFLFVVGYSIGFFLLAITQENASIVTPKASDLDIMIITPENITYTEAMNGYYPGSIGFEDDLIGTIPDDWWYRVPDGGSFYRVVEEWQGRKKVYEIRKNGGLIKVETNVNFSTPASVGSVDFWLYKDTGSGIDPSRINLEDGYETDYFTFGFEAETFYTGTWQNKQQVFPNAFSEDKWHYVKVDFNLSKGWQVQIDDTIYGAGYAFTTFVGNPTQVMNFQLESIWSGDNPNYGAWLDSIGYSWDPNYNIGDNKQEGLLLGYNNYTNLEWMGYSLDGQLNRTILGNTTIPFPTNGVHSIQVLGNDTYGTYYQSDIRVFEIKSLNDIKIITPQNKVYNGPMQGYYPATYGFENDADGSIPNGWDFIPHHGFGNGYIITNVSNHKKVLVIEDVSASAYPEIFQTFNPQTIGTVEFYICKGFGPSTCIISLYDNVGQNVVVLNIDEGNNGEFQYLSESGYYIPFADGMYADDTWFHIRIDFNTQTDIFDVYLNQQLVLSNNDFYLPVLSIEKIRFGSNYAYTGIFYIDAVGYSWDSNYIIGDNLKEGLLLSFENDTSLNWIGYSLDGQPNRTIYGNITLPLPSNDEHSIKIFGVDSAGFTHQSSLRVFLIDYEQPNTPDIPPEIPNVDNMPFFMLIIIGVSAILGITLVVVIIVNNVPRKLRSEGLYGPPIMRDKSYIQKPYEEKLLLNNPLIQCPYCLRWDEPGGIYCSNCGQKVLDNRG